MESKATVVKNQRRTIGNKYSDVKYVADKFDIEVWEVYKVRSDLKTNIRARVYSEIESRLSDGRLTPQTKDNGK